MLLYRTVCRYSPAANLRFINRMAARGREFVHYVGLAKRLLSKIPKYRAFRRNRRHDTVSRQTTVATFKTAANEQIT